jgi:hypothetical protein
MRKIGLLAGFLLSGFFLCSVAYSADPADRQRPQSTPALELPAKNVSPVIPAPSNLTASVDAENRISLRWTWTSSATIAGFKIERKEGTGGFVPFNEVGASVRGYVEAGPKPKPETLYTFRVKAYKVVDGNEVSSPYSNEASVKTLDIKPLEKTITKKKP